MESIPWPAVGSGSGWALVVLVIVGIVRGWLVTKPEVDRLDHDRNEWRAESRIKDQQLLEKDIQLRHMEEVGKTVNQIMRSIHRNARSPEQGRDEDP